MDTVQYLEAVKKELGITSDYALAQRLQMTRSAISNLQSRKNTMGDQTAMKVAAILKKNPAVVLCDVQAERNNDPMIQAVWMNLVEKISLGFDALVSHVTPHGIRLSTR